MLDHKQSSKRAINYITMKPIQSLSTQNWNVAVKPCLMTYWFW